MQQRLTQKSGSTASRPRAKRALLALTVVHPVPSLLNAGLVATIALIAGAAGPVAASLAIAMLGFQFSIGALNDVADAESDRVRKPRKPVPAGIMPVELAILISVLGAVVGFVGPRRS